MATNEETLKLRLDADLSGGIATRKEMDAIRDKAKQMNAETQDGAAKTGAAFGRVTGAARLMRAALGGFGAVGLFTWLLASISKIADSFKGAKREADEFAKAEKTAAEAKELKDLADGWKRVEESIRATTAAREHDGKVLDQQISNARALEDAQLELQEQKELAAVDASDPAAEQQRAQIKARYAAQRQSLAASRGKEDVVYQRQKLQGEADAKRAEAATTEEALASTDAAITARKKRLIAARDASIADNSEDGGAFAAYGNVLKNFFTGNWGELSASGEGMNRTEAGDKVRAEAKEEAAALEKEIAALEEQKAAKLKEIATLRQEAARAEEMKDALGGQLEVSDLKAEAARLSGSEGVQAADRARATKEKEIAAKEEKKAQEAVELARNRGLLASAQNQLAVLTGQRERIRDEKAANGLAMAQAGDAYGAAVANGASGRVQREAFAEKQRGESAAREAGFALDKAEAGIVSSIEALTARIKKLQGAIEQAEKRAKNAASDAAGGDA